MEELPPEMIRKIMLWLPDFKSIGMCKCVCKLWYFILSQCNLSKTTPDLLLYFKPVPELSETTRMYYIEDNGPNLNKRPLCPLKLLDESYIKESFRHIQPNIMGSCRGFICLLSTSQLGDTFFNNFVYIYNPLTEEQVRLPPFKSRPSNTWLSGFGFDHSNKVFKVVFIHLRHNTQIVLENELRVHTLGSNVWRSKYGIIPNELLLSAKVHWSSTLTNGCLHWIIGKQTVLPHGPKIVSFNLDVEEFGYIPIPGLKRLQSDCYQLGLIGEQLSVVEWSCYPHVPCINVWVMKEYNVKESWVMKFSVGHELGYCVGAPKLVKLRENGELLLLPNDRYMVGYNTVTQKWRRLPLGWESKPKNYLLEIHPIKGSLLSVKKTFGIKKTSTAKRKR